MADSKSNRTAGFGTAAKDKLREESRSTENTRGIENHRKTAEHFALASKYHYEAARYHEEGNHERASQSAILGIGHAALANEYQTQGVKFHVLES